MEVMLETESKYLGNVAVIIVSVLFIKQVWN